MRKVLAVAGIAALVAVLGVVAIGAVTYAQDDGNSGPFDYGRRFREAVAEILDISVEEYDAAVEQARKQVLDQAMEEGVLTEDQADRMQERLDKGFGARGRDRGLVRPPVDKGFKRPHIGKDFMGRGGFSIVGAVAEVLELTPQDLVEALEGGKSIAEVAEGEGVDPQDILDAFQAEIEERLKRAVDNGRLTQEQADEMVARAMEMAREQLDRTWEGRFPGRFPRDGQPGRMRGFRGETDA